MPSACLTSLPLNGMIHAKAGTLVLTLIDETGHIFFDCSPGATYVTDGGGTNVPFVSCDAKSLSFKMASGNSYQLIIVHKRDLPGSRGYLVENCNKQTPLGIISDADTFAEFDFVVF